MMVTCAACGNQVLISDDSAPPSYKCAVCAHVNVLQAGGGTDDDDLDIDVGGQIPDSVPLLDDDDSNEALAPPTATGSRGPSLAPEEGDPGYGLAQKSGRIKIKPLAAVRGKAGPTIATCSVLLRVAALGVLLLAVGGVLDSFPALMESGRASMIFGILSAACVAGWLGVLAKLLFSGAAGLKRGEAEWRSAMLFLSATWVVGAPALAFLLSLGGQAELAQLSLRFQLILAWLGVLGLLGLGCYVLWAVYLKNPGYFVADKAAKKRVDVFSQLIIYTVLGAVGLGSLALIEVQSAESGRDQSTAENTTRKPEGVETYGTEPRASSTDPEPKPGPKRGVAAGARTWELAQKPAIDGNHWFSVRPPAQWQRVAPPMPDQGDATVSRLCWAGRPSPGGPDLWLEASCSADEGEHDRPRVLGASVPDRVEAQDVLVGEREGRLYVGGLDVKRDAIVLVIDSLLTKRTYTFSLSGPKGRVDRHRPEFIAFTKTLQPVSIPVEISPAARVVVCEYGKVTLAAPTGFKKKRFRDQPDETIAEYARGPHAVVGLRVVAGQSLGDVEVCGTPLRDLLVEGQPLTIGERKWRLRSGLARGAYRADAWLTAHLGRQYIIYGWSLPSDHSNLRLFIKAWMAKLEFAKPEPPKVTDPTLPGPGRPEASAPAAGVKIPGEHDQKAKMTQALMRRDLEESGRHALTGSSGGQPIELLADARGRYLCAVYSRRTSTLAVWRLETGQKLVEASTRYRVGAATIVPGTSLLVLGDSQGFVRWVPLDKMGQGRRLTPGLDGETPQAQPNEPPGPMGPGNPRAAGGKAASARLSEVFPIEGWRASTKPIVALAVSPDRSALAVASEDMTVRVWKATLERSEQLGRFYVSNTRVIRQLAFTPDGKRIAVVTNQSWAEIHYWQAKKPIRKLSVTNAGQCTDVAFSENGEVLAVGTSNGIVRTWQAASLKPMRVLKGGGTARPTRRTTPRRFGDRRRAPVSVPIARVALSADGSRLAMAVSKTIWVWDTGTGKPICQIPASAGRVGGSFCHVTFLPIDGLLAGAHSNGRIELLDLSQLALGGGLDD
jgi:WD40 repeat protein